MAKNKRGKIEKRPAKPFKRQASAHKAEKATAKQASQQHNGGIPFGLHDRILLVGEGMSNLSIVQCRKSKLMI